MNKKAIELAISTLILIVLGVILLIAIVYALTGGFEKFTSTTAPFTDTSQATAVKTACQDACNNDIKLTYCCQEYEINNENIKCSDSRLELNCNLDCSEFSCE